MRRSRDLTMPDAADLAVVMLAERQHGLVSRRQLLDAGIGAIEIARRVRRGDLVPQHRGVYLASAAPGHFASAMAAVLACGDGAVASHRAAAVVHGVLPACDPAEPVDVTLLASDDRGRRPGIRAHRVATFDTTDVATIEDVPVTSIIRTLIDLGGVASSRALEQALAAAQHRALVGRADILEAIRQRPRARGVRRLSDLVHASRPPLRIRSELEFEFLQVMGRTDLPTASVNFIVLGYEVDFCWPAARLITELDGFEYHSSRPAFENDRRRDRALHVAGWTVIRVTWRQLRNEREAVISDVSQVYGRQMALAEARNGHPAVSWHPHGSRRRDSVDSPGPWSQSWP
jgi:hypothetical protein